MRPEVSPIAVRIRHRVVTAGLGLWLCGIWASSAVALPFLAVDMDARAGSASVTAAGYQSFTLTGSLGTAVPNTTRTIGSYNVSVTAVNSSGAAVGSLDDRHRTTPTGTPTLDELYRDFIFAGTTTGVGGGMNLEISGGVLVPNSQYSVSLYAFDSGSTASPQPRTADWLDGNNGNALLFSTAFSGSALPTADGQYKYTALANTDAAGKLFLEGRNTLSSGIGVFLNGFEIAAPVTLTLEINTTTGAMRFLNEQNVSFDMNYYEIRSAAGSLKPSGWISLDKTEGGDPLGAGWDEAPASSATLLNEARLEGMTTLAANKWESLGSAYSPGGAQDVTFSFAGPNDGVLRSGTVKYVTGAGSLYGDYNGNGVVDAADYVRWRKGGTLQNEGRTTGVTDQSDYNFWRLRFGAVSGSGSGASPSGLGVPEPAGLLLLVFAAVRIGFLERRTR